VPASLRLPSLALVGALALASALALSTALAPGTARAADGGGVAWSVQTADNAHGTGRGNFTYAVEPGAVISDTMIVVNTGTEPLPLAVYAADAFTASTGEIDILVDGAPSADAGTWVAVSTPALELAPGHTADVPFTVTVPADARPGDHSAGIVTSLTSQDPANALSVDRRLGTRLTVRVAGDLVPAASATAVSARYDGSWNPFESGRLTVSYSLENTGNTRLTGLETIDTSGTGGLFGTRTPPLRISEVLPGSTIDVVREVPVFSLGWVAGSVTVAPEGVGLGAGTVEPVALAFSTPAVPWSLYALIVLVIAAVAAALVAGRRLRRRARPQTPPQAV
jgi:hypothetical protein